MLIAIIIIGAVFFGGVSAYLYYVYAPLPTMPVLSSAIQTGNMIIGHHDRTYRFYVPQNRPQSPGLILALHGTGMNADRMRQWTGYELDMLADKYGFIVVYPDGYKSNWNDCRKNAPFPAKKENIDDIGFITQLITRFEAGQQVNRQKV